MSGSGFAAGPEYVRRDLLHERLEFHSAAVFSVKQYEMFDAGARLPHLAHEHVFLDVDLCYRNYPSLNYYGPGPQSAKTGRSDYRLEESTADLNGGIRPIRHLRIGGFAGYTLINVGPGIDDRFVSTAQIYSPETTPGRPYATIANSDSTVSDDW